MDHAELGIRGYAYAAGARRGIRRGSIDERLMLYGKNLKGETTRVFLRLRPHFDF
jgi:hypothetical protein